MSRCPQTSSSGAETTPGCGSGSVSGCPSCSPCPGNREHPATAGPCRGPGWAPGSGCGAAVSARLRCAPCQAANAVPGKHVTSLQEGLNCWAVGPWREGFARSPSGALVVPAGAAVAAFPALPAAGAKPLSLKGPGAGADMGLILHWCRASSHHLGPWPGPAGLPLATLPSMPPSTPCHSAGQPVAPQGAAPQEDVGSCGCSPGDPIRPTAAPKDLFLAAPEAMPGPELAAARHGHRQAHGHCQSFNESQTAAWLEVTD